MVDKSSFALCTIALELNHIQQEYTDTYLNTLYYFICSFNSVLKMQTISSGITEIIPLHC